MYLCFINFILLCMKKGENRPFLSCFDSHYESEAKCKVFVMKISFHSYANITNFHMISFALSLAFIVRFKATRKWPIKNERMRPKTHGSTNFARKVANAHAVPKNGA